ncbi:hypothetical protein ACQ4PT_020340 [Festuca glaucescens]
MPSSPSVLVLYRLKPAVLAELAGRFRLLDSHASPLPLDAFLVATAAGDDPPRAAVVPGSGVVRIDARGVPGRRPVAGLRRFHNRGPQPRRPPRVRARRGVAVANAAGIYSADVAVGLLIDALRGISAGDCFLRRRGEFLLSPLGGSRLGGKRVGIIGLGSIRSAIARRLKAFGCVVSYHSRRRKHGVSYGYHPTVLGE